MVMKIIMVIVSLSFMWGHIHASTSITRSALMDLYTLTNGPAWLASTGWNTNADYCTWYGVSCVDNEVTQLVLNKNHLTGSIPASIGNLVNLQFCIYQITS